MNTTFKFLGALLAGATISTFAQAHSLSYTPADTPNYAFEKALIDSFQKEVNNIYDAPSAKFIQQSQSHGGGERIGGVSVSGAIIPLVGSRTVHDSYLSTAYQQFKKTNPNKPFNIYTNNGHYVNLGNRPFINLD